mmetsp:Transcript_6462/g.13285  ORF Transcript_6462/g.13285 Transcript_6462/m.13285 type:complete len:197 (+) Transcript_6462:118-708(+)
MLPAHATALVIALGIVALLLVAGGYTMCFRFLYGPARPSSPLSCEAGERRRRRRTNHVPESRELGDDAAGAANTTTLSELEVPGVMLRRQEVERCFPAKRAKQGSPGEAGAAAGEEQGCAVCLGAIEEGDFCRELSCGHAFHAGCVMEWWLRAQRASLECPMCRRPQHDARKAKAAEAPNMIGSPSRARGTLWIDI